MRKLRFVVFVLACVLCAVTAMAATYRGRNVDGRWFEGRATSTTYGAYDCQIRFDGDRALLRLSSLGLQIVTFLDDEVITDPRDLTVYDPRRGVYWSLSIFNLGS